MNRGLYCALFAVLFALQASCIIVKEAEIEGEVKQTVFLTDRDVILLTSLNKVLKSSDFGQTFVEIDPTGGMNQGGVVKIVEIPSSPTKQVFFDSESVIYSSSNMGQSFLVMSTPELFNTYMPHKSDSDMAIATAGDINGCQMRVYFTKDFGVSWNLLARDVCEADWNALAQPSDYSVILIQASGNTKVAKWINQFDETIKSVNKVSGYFQNEGGVLLWTDSNDIKVATDSALSFQHVKSTLSAESILEMKFMREAYGSLLGSVTTGSQGVHVDGFSEWAKIFKLTGHGSGIVESISDIHTMSDGTVAFYAVPGLDSMYLVNQVENTGPVRELGALPVLQTKLSVDHGATWDSLKCPTDPSALHLKILSENAIPGILGSEHTVGLIVGVGNCGSHLKMDHSQMSTYYSLDGGISWRVVSEEALLTSIADFGGFAAMLPLNGDKFVKYSKDYFKTIEKFDYTSTEKFIPSKASFTNSELSLYLLATGAGEALSANFNGVFTSTCGDSDYETVILWKDSGNCLMGKTWNLTRRSHDKECEMQKAPNAPQYKSCECSFLDFECDVGFMRNQAPNVTEFDCIPVGGAFYKGFQQFCVPMLNRYYVTGYSKIMGDGCTKGIELSSSYMPCGLFDNGMLIVMSFAAICYTIVMVIVVGGFGWYWFAKTMRGKEMWGTLMDYFRNSNATYEAIWDSIPLGSGPVVQDEEMETIKNN